MPILFPYPPSALRRRSFFPLPFCRRSARTRKNDFPFLPLLEILPPPPAPPYRPVFLFLLFSLFPLPRCRDNGAQFHHRGYRENPPFPFLRSPDRLTSSFLSSLRVPAGRILPSPPPQATIERFPLRFPDVKAFSPATSDPREGSPSYLFRRVCR